MAAVAGGLLAIGAGLVLGGGDDDPEPAAPAAVVAADPGAGTTAPVGAGGLGATTVASGSGRSALAGFAEAQVTVVAPDGERCQTCMLVAADADQRARGLMEVTDPDLGGYDGMLFVYDRPTDGSFWMRNTPLPLTLSYLDESGTVISQADLEPCADVATCPSYPASDRFQYAIEVPVEATDPVEVQVGSSIVIEAYTCPES